MSVSEHHQNGKSCGVFQVCRDWYYQKCSKEEKTVNRQKGPGRPRIINTWGNIYINIPLLKKKRKKKKTYIVLTEYYGFLGVNISFLVFLGIFFTIILQIAQTLKKLTAHKEGCQQVLLHERDLLDVSIQ